MFVSHRRRRQFAGTWRIPEGRRPGAGHAYATLQRAEGADRRESRVLPGRGAEHEERVARVAHAVHVARVPIYRTDRVVGGYVSRFSRAGTYLKMSNWEAQTKNAGGPWWLVVPFGNTFEM